MSENTKVEDTAQGDEEEIPLANQFPFALGEGPEFKWYAAHVLTGQENKVVKALKERILQRSMNDNFANILVPEEEVKSNVNGRKRTYKRKFFPGYILIKMKMNENTWHLVKNTDKISGFLGGSKSIPDPIPEDQVRYMTEEIVTGKAKTTRIGSFAEGDQVKVVEGPFESFTGEIEHVSDKGKVRVNVSIFGRPTPVELDFSQIEKL